MSFLAELKTRKRNLKLTDTTVTYPDGKCYIESRCSTLPVQTKDRPYGYVVDNKPDDKPAKILDFLYLGSQDCCTKEVLQQHNILHVISIGIGPPASYDGITYSMFECLDLPETNIWNIINSSAVVIRNLVKKCENILVHCNAGVSRSASVVIGYLILEHNYDFVKAFEHVHCARTSIRPNDGFLKQLRDYHLYI